MTATVIAEAAGAVLYVAGLAAGVDHAPLELTNVELAAKVAEGINEERRIAGLPALVADPALVPLAEFRNTQNIGWGQPLSHVNPLTGRLAMHEAQERFGWMEYPLSGEVLAANNWTWALSPQVAVDGWMRSPVHRPVLLEPSFVTMAVAAWRFPDGSTWYCVEFLSAGGLRP